MDALQCFSSISESVPSWVTRVTDLAAHTSRKHAEFSEEFKRLASTPTGVSRYRRRQNSSVHSIRPLREGHIDNTTRPSSTASSSSSIGGEKVVSAVRPRLQLIIYYDGHTQFEFEQAVREISNARNLLRKGKMSQFMRGARGSGLFVSTRQSRESLGTSQLPTNTTTATDGYRLRSSADQKESAFEAADKQLDIAQGLCETGAHHFLRFGDCTKELEQIRAKFEAVLEIATHEVNRLREEQQQQQQETGLTEKIAAIVETTSPKSLYIASTISASDNDKPSALANDAIEVDDAASEASIHIDIKAFRSNRFRM